jgi:flagellar basal body-associated protein FliL
MKFTEKSKSKNSGQKYRYLAIIIYMYICIINGRASTFCFFLKIGSKTRKKEKKAAEILLINL